MLRFGYYQSEDKAVSYSDWEKGSKRPTDSNLFHYSKLQGSYWSNIAEMFARSFFAFMRHYVFRLGFLDGYHGVLISVIQMQYTFNKYNFLKFKEVNK